MSTDLLVVGATPSGIAAAIRAAREGLSVVLTNRTPHVGGMWTSGLQFFDTIYGGPRAPILDEFTRRLQDHYRATFGDPSPEYEMSRYGDPTRHGRRPHFECHVAEAVFEAMLQEEPLIEVSKGWIVVAVRRAGTRIESVTLRRYHDDVEREIVADSFVDATYEGDLAALAGVPYRIGRESRSEYGELHAGVIYTRIHPVGYPKERYLAETGLHMFSRASGAIYAGSTGAGDGAVMAYCARLVLTSDASNRIPISKPVGYSPERYEAILFDEVENLDRDTKLGSHQIVGSVESMTLGAPTAPNGKRDWIGANLVEGGHAYPDAEWPAREEIIREHQEFAVGLLYFLQTDDRVPPHVRKSVGEWGLPKDEFVDNAGLPWDIYVREARRIVGRSVITEHDATTAPGLLRAPVRHDSVGFTEWPMDSHDCWARRVPGSLNEGEFMLTELTRPAQIPYSSLLPIGVDNLLVSVCISATHVAWGTVRVEPTLMPVGEAAGWAAALAKNAGSSLALIPIERLQRRLVENRFMIGFLADLDAASNESWAPAMFYLSSKGLITSYHARGSETLISAVGRVWVRAAVEMLADASDPSGVARAVARAEREADGTGMAAGEFVAAIREECGRQRIACPDSLEALGAKLSDHALTRGEAASIIYDITAQ